VIHQGNVMATTDSSSILGKIVASKRREIEQSRSCVSERELEARLALAPPVRDFHKALAAGQGVRLIAEVKKASPSAGVLRADFDPVAIARTYVAAGAAALSVLTDEPFFQGRLEHLQAIRAAVEVPILRKDFLLERYQLLEARAAGADAVLLIAEILDDKALPQLIGEAAALGLHTLVELYDPANLPRVLAAGALIIGINNRDLRTFNTRPEHTLELVPKLPAGCLLVSESGIRNRDDVRRLEAAGVHAVLIGETFMRAQDIGAKVRELMQD
jgi:indole-3-glycerol phosphate synthase